MHYSRQHQLHGRSCRVADFLTRVQLQLCYSAAMKVVYLHWITITVKIHPTNLMECMLTLLKNASTKAVIKNLIKPDLLQNIKEENDMYYSVMSDNRLSSVTASCKNN
jgi:hypothetical protein